MLRFSIVTACLNRAALVRDAIESVLAQEYPEFEHVIVDGGSADGTLEILSQYRHLRVVSEPDDGIYDAWNKGIARCTGDVIGILNSDDFYADGVFWEVARTFQADDQIEMVTGKALQFTENGDGSWTIDSKYEEVPGGQLDPSRLILWAPIINARFLRARLYRRAGYFDGRYAIAADCDFAFRLARLRPRCGYLNRHVYYYRTHSGSTSLDGFGRNDWISYGEKLSIAESWLADKSLSFQDRRTLRRRHSEKAAIGALTFLMRAKLRKAVIFLIRGQRWNLAFPLAILRETTRILIYQVTKRLRHPTEVIRQPPVAHLTRPPGDAGYARFD